MLACGWLGEALAAALVADGHAVRGATTTPVKAERLRARGVVPHLLRLEPEPAGATTGFFASDLLVLTLPPSPFDDHPAAMGSAAAAAATGGAGRLIFTSSTSVYADRSPDEIDAPVTEDDPRPPDGARGERMRAAERAVRDAFAAATILRLGGLWGPGRDPGRFLAGKRDVPGPDAPVNIVHRDDAIGAVRAVIAADARSETFNVVAPAHPSRSAFYTAAAVRAELEPPRFAPAPAGGSPGKRVSAAKLERALGYRFARLPDAE